MEKQLVAIATAYDALPSGPPINEQARKSYSAFCDEVKLQFDNLFVRVSWWSDPGQPYANSREMFADIDRGHLWVFTGGEAHPFMTNQENCLFRAVHDYYGHYLERNEFGKKGELAAWRFHARMFSDLALDAMTAETLGQNCWVNYGPFAHLPRNERPFAEQKANLLPRSLWYHLLEMKK